MSLDDIRRAQQDELAVAALRADLEQRVAALATGFVSTALPRLRTAAAEHLTRHGVSAEVGIVEKQLWRQGYQWQPDPDWFEGGKALRIYIPKALTVSVCIFSTRLSLPPNLPEILTGATFHLRREISHPFPDGSGGYVWLDFPVTRETLRLPIRIWSSHAVDERSHGTTLPGGYYAPWASDRDTQPLVDALIAALEGRNLPAPTWRWIYRKVDTPWCFVASAVFQNPEHPTVVALRHYRDARMTRTLLGRGFIRLYSCIGPIMARVVHRRPYLRRPLAKCLNGIAFLMRRGSRGHSVHSQ